MANYHLFTIRHSSLFTIHHTLHAQYAEVYPTNWWVGMKWNKVQLLIKGGYAEFNKEQIKQKLDTVFNVSK